MLLDIAFVCVRIVAYITWNHVNALNTYLTLINTGKYHKSCLIKALIRTKDQPKNTSEGL